MNFIEKSENLRNYLLTNDFKTVIIVTNQKMKKTDMPRMCRKQTVTRTYFYSYFR